MSFDVLAKLVAADVAYLANRRPPPSPDKPMTSAFDGLVMFASEMTIWQVAEGTCEATHSPCGVWERDGWYVASPDPDPPHAVAQGWRLLGIVDGVEP